MLSLRSFAFVLVSLLLLSCSSATSSPQSPSDVGSKSDSSESTWTPSEEEGQVEEARAMEPDCSDGTCFPCGEGICPQGAYCDEDAQGGAACAWLPECKEAPTCSCVTKVLGATCSCTEDNGGPLIRCD